MEPEEQFFNYILQRTTISPTNHLITKLWALVVDRVINFFGF
jgi:hypothetical protein